MIKRYIKAVSVSAATLCFAFAVSAGAVLFAHDAPAQNPLTNAVNTYPIVDTGQVTFFGNRDEISRPSPGDACFGQDAEYTRNAPAYKDNGDGTVTDLVTGLIWQKSFEVMSYDDALEKLKSFSLAGKHDWRLPTIKELYSLMLFSGTDVSGPGMSGGGPGMPGGGVDQPGSFGRGSENRFGRRPPPNRQRNGFGGFDRRPGPGRDGRPMPDMMGEGGDMHGRRPSTGNMDGGGRFGQSPSSGNRPRMQDNARSSRSGSQGGTPFIDTRYFDFKYASNGRRKIDTQLLSSTLYQGKTMGGQDTVFGLNVADGRIKGYPLLDPPTRTGKPFTVRFVRGNPNYGKNNFKNNNNGTITDLATGLMWQASDSGRPMSWKNALQWVQDMNRRQYLTYSDWRLPNAKELQSLLDYSRSPQKSGSAAINPMFKTSEIKDEGGNRNYPFYWTSTTHKNLRGGGSAVYIAFGEALGFFRPPGSWGRKKLMDVHGAGAQRSDPKVGDPDDYPEGHGPQGDVIRIFNYVRMVRDAVRSEK